MCGIFLALSGYKPDQLKFNFDPYSYYLNNFYVKKYNKKNLNFYENLLSKNLFI